MNFCNINKFLCYLFLCRPASARTINFRGHLYFGGCYLSMNDEGVCSNSIASLRGTKAACCCSIGVAWGHDCDRCPESNSGEHVFQLIFGILLYRIL